jgi:hypothetical protein
MYVYIVIGHLFSKPTPWTHVQPFFGSDLPRNALSNSNRERCTRHLEFRTSDKRVHSQVTAKEDTLLRKNAKL